MDIEHQIAQETSLYIRQWIIKQSAVKEESITDWLLFTLSEKIPRIIYKAFTRTEEARVTGADWEWWFVYPTYSFKMRVQAKKLSPNKDNYHSIAHTNQYGLQIDKLLDDAIQKNYAPFYAFYTAETAKVMCEKNINDEGVYIAGATTVFNKFVSNGKKQVQTSDALAISIALSCLFGCPLITEKEDGPIYFFQRYYSEGVRRSPDPSLNVPLSNQNTLGFHSEIPNYILTLLENKEKIPGWWETEFSHDIQGTNAIVIYDGRNF